MIRINIYQWGRILMAGACIGMASCANDADDTLPTETVDFTAQVTKAAPVRITGTAWDGDELIVVKGGENVRTYTVAQTGAMQATGDSFQWQGTDYEVVAWTPYTPDIISLTGQTSSARFYDCDLLCATATVSSKHVHLAFRHAMTRMTWEIRKAEGYTADELKQAKVSFIGYGAVRFNEGVPSPVGYADQTIATLSANAGDTRRGEAMMAPCEMWELPLIRVDIAGETYTYTPSKSVATDVEKNKGILKAGLWQKYYLTLPAKSTDPENPGNPGEIDVEMEYSTNISEWVTDEDSDKGSIQPLPLLP